MPSDIDGIERIIFLYNNSDNTSGFYNQSGPNLYDVWKPYEQGPYKTGSASICSPPTASISADSTNIPYGDHTTIRWSSTNADSCAVSPGGPSGWTGISGAQFSDWLTSSQTYTVNCSGSRGSASNSVTVNVASPPPGNFSLGLGGSVACNTVPLSWSSSSNADSYRIYRNGSDITPYTYTATNYMDTSVNQGANYNYYITAGNGSGSTNSNTINTTTPYCPPTVSLSSSRTSVYQGQTSTLTWSSTYANSCSASGSWSGSKPTSGSETVNPALPGATYTLTCSNPGASASQSVNIEVLPLALPEWREIIPR